MDRALFTAYDGPEFRIFYEQYGPLKVFHNELKVPWSPAVGRRFKRAAQHVLEEIGEPLFAAFYLNGQHGPEFDKWLRWIGFEPFRPGRYDNTDCIFYIKVR
jgi:hypothetical protein